MAHKRFSSQVLFVIRNNIEINVVISELLKMPVKISEGHLRFLCPICHEFTTATNRKTNLGRCFRCRQNFNTIEIVMLDKKINFIAAVALLQDYLHVPPATAVCSNGRSMHG